VFVDTSLVSLSEDLLGLLFLFFMKGGRKKICFFCMNSSSRNLNHLVFSSAHCQPSTVLVSCAFSWTWGRLV